MSLLGWSSAMHFFKTCHFHGHNASNSSHSMWKCNLQRHFPMQHWQCGQAVFNKELWSVQQRKNWFFCLFKASSKSPITCHEKVQCACDKGTISSVIQSTNQSRVPSSGPGTDVHPKGKDTMSNPEHKLERKRWVPTPCSITMLHNPAGMFQQVHLTMTKHAHRAINLANEDVNLVGAFDQTWTISHGSLTLMTFEFACKSICSFGETSEQESFFLRCCSLRFVPCLRSNFRWIIVVCHLPTPPQTHCESERCHPWHWWIT